MGSPNSSLTPTETSCYCYQTICSASELILKVSCFKIPKAGHHSLLVQYQKSRTSTQKPTHTNVMTKWRDFDLNVDGIVLESDFAMSQ